MKFFAKFMIIAIPLAVMSGAGIRVAIAQPRASLDLSRTRFDTTLIVRSNHATTVPPSTQAVAFSRGEIVAGRINRNAVRKQVDDKLIFQIPYEMYFVSPTGETITMRPVAEVEGGGLRVRPDLQGFLGSLQVGLENAEDPSSSEDVGQDVNVLVTAMADSISRPNLAIGHTNLPYESVKIYATNPPDSVHVRLRPSFDPSGIEFSVPVVRPTLHVTISPDEIQGYGLETATILVQVRGVRDPREVVVSLSSDKSKLDPVRIKMDAAGFGESSIRSIGTGRAVVSATNPLFKPAEGTLGFVFPMAFLIFASLGGLLGGLGRFLKDGMNSLDGMKWRRIGLYLLAGLVFGYILAGLSSIGINLLPAAPVAGVGEAVVCFIAALGGFGGSTLLSNYIEAKR